MRSWKTVGQKAQYNLSTALELQAERNDGDERTALFAEAVVGYRGVLDTITGEPRHPFWAKVQTSLGGALERQAAFSARTSWVEGIKLLAEAATAFGAALEALPREGQPVAWAMTQCKLGHALKLQGMRLRGAKRLELLSKAETAFRNALEMPNTKALSVFRATTQNHLGVALLLQSPLIEETERIAVVSQAAAAFRDALKAPRTNSTNSFEPIVRNNLDAALKAHVKLIGG